MRGSQPLSVTASPRLAAHVRRAAAAVVCVAAMAATFCLTGCSEASRVGAPTTPFSLVPPPGWSNTGIRDSETNPSWHEFWASASPPSAAPTALTPPSLFVSWERDSGGPPGPGVNGTQTVVRRLSLNLDGTAANGVVLSDGSPTQDIELSVVRQDISYGIECSERPNHPEDGDTCLQALGTWHWT